MPRSTSTTTVRRARVPGARARPTTRPAAAAADRVAGGDAPTRELTVLGIETPLLGDRSYLVHDGAVAFVVDPPRDVTRVLDLLGRHQVRLTHVLETHVHTHHVTGGPALAGRTGAAYLAGVGHGEFVVVGPRMRLIAQATPGHTADHLAYVLTDLAVEAPVAVFTGGSMLHGGTGWPDLLGRERLDALVRAQHGSVRWLAQTLPDSTAVFPTHRRGSSWSVSTIGEQRRCNPALWQDAETYLAGVLAGLGA